MMRRVLLSILIAVPCLHARPPLLDLWQRSRPVGFDSPVEQSRFAAECLTEVADAFDFSEGRRWAGVLRPAGWSIRALAAERWSGLPFLPPRAKHGESREAFFDVAATMQRLEPAKPRGYRSEADWLDIPAARDWLGNFGSRYHGHPLLGLESTEKDEYAPPKTRMPHYAGPLEQAFLAAPERIRLSLVTVLAKLPGDEAAHAVARRAVFDLSPEVRRLALRALPLLPRRPVIAELVRLMRHPWPAAGEHAAEALRELKATEALPSLKRLALLPPVDQPFRDEAGRWRRTELARIDHVSNCLLCHPPATALAAGPVRRLPEGKPPPGFQGIDAGISILRPEFAVRQTDGRRYDFVIRERPLTDEERKAHLVARAEERDAASPQRRTIRKAVDAIQRMHARNP